MNKLFIGFLIFLFGVMAGYGWQHHHNALFRDEVKSNRILIADMDRKLVEFENALSVRQQAIDIILCESSMRHDNTYGDGGKSFGWAQFQKRTFKWMSEQAGYQNLKWQNPYHQLVLLEWAIESGIAVDHWKVCYEKVKS